MFSDMNTGEKIFGAIMAVIFAPICGVVFFGIALIGWMMFINPMIAATTGINKEYASGEKTGVVYKISKEGFIWQTWEGEMNLGGLQSGSGSSSVTVWKFSVKDDAIVEKLQELSKTGSMITLTYTAPWVQAYRDGESGYLVTEIK